MQPEIFMGIRHAWNFHLIGTQRLVGLEKGSVFFLDYREFS